MRKFTDDYETVVTVDEEGREKEIVEYRGDYFKVVLAEDAVRNFRRNNLLLLVVIVFFHISGGFVSNRGMYQFYVALPYVFAYFPLFFMGEGILRLPKEKGNYRRDEIGLSFDRVKTTSRIVLVLLGMAVLGEIIFLLFFPVREQLLLEILYLALELIAVAAVFMLIGLQKKIRVEPCADQSQE